MSEVRPFRGLVFASRFGPDLGALIAPPYDVISQAKRASLAARHPHNIVHIDLPGAAGAPGAPDDPYEHAGRLLEDWRRAEVLVRDTRPALYVCEQAYDDPTGARRTRRGLFARLRLESFERGTIIPHERTMDRPRADRTRLLRATRTHLSAVFLLHPDPGGAVGRQVAEAAAMPPFAVARDDDGTASRIVRLADEGRVSSIAAGLAGQWALIADGHHRYESALAYRDERRAAGVHDAETVLAFLCSLEDSGLSIFPIHRLVHSLPRFEPARLRERLAMLGALEKVPDLEAARAILDRERGRSGRFGLLFAGEEGAWVARVEESVALDRPEMAAIPAALRGLDVVLLHRIVLEGHLGIDLEAQAGQANLDYVKEARELEERVRSGGAQIGVLMNPTRIEQVVAVSRAGLRLPQKSTYFHPKVLTGLVLDPLDS